MIALSLFSLLCVSGVSYLLWFLAASDRAAEATAKSLRDRGA